MLGARGALELAAALLHYADPGLDDRKSVGSAHPTAQGRPPQVAVLGPTQTGKSTVVNLLLGASAAEVSPLAGFTVHPHGFCTDGDAERSAWAASLFPGWRRRDPHELVREDLAAYTLTDMGAPPPPLPPCVIWDTPDFDSLAARQYARGVLEVAALADVYVLVLSKEKYSDLSAWRMLELLEPLGRPLIIVLNKQTPEAEPLVSASLRARLAERGAAWGEVSILSLPYDPTLSATGAAAAAAVRLRGAVSTCLRTVGPRPRGIGVLLHRHWDTWLTPIRAEHRALQAWSEAVATAGQQFVAAYGRDYLDHPQRYDGFRRATVVLLSLLEIPQVAGPVSRVRQLITWPMRRLLAVGQTWWEQRRAPAHARHSLGTEATVLVAALDGLLTGLHRDVLRNAARAADDTTLWRALARRLDDEQMLLRQKLETAVAAHHEQVSQEIGRTADRLYAELRKQPARLAALRTARVTLDVGSLLLAVKTAGLTPWDVLWAPAAFAAASLLMEGMAGVEFAHEARKLKERQRVAIAQEFVPSVLVRELTSLPTGLTDARLFGLTGEEVAVAEETLARWEQAE